MVTLNRRRTIVGGLVAAAGLVGAVAWTWASPEEREIRAIQKRLKSFARDVSFAGGGSPIQRLSYPSQVVDYFADPVQFQLAIGPWNSRGTVIQTRAELQEGTTAYRASSKGLKVEFLDIAVTLEPSLTRATAHLTSTVHFVGDADYWVQEFRLTLIKESAVWRIQALATVRTMEQ
ncbi:MAG: hypothetical protein JNK85_14225 [Verrucomicrobiales bacterium]|nr:hypothetical protein [Verrucomicrobiales bacterium]